MPSDLQAIHDQFMAALNAQDAAASQQMLDVWSKAWLHIQAAIQQLDARIEKAKQLGQFSPSWAYQQGRLDDVEQTVKNQIENLVATATQLTLNNQEHAITQGQAFAEQSAIAQLGGIAQMATVGVRWGRLNPEAVKDLTGYLAHGSPLTALLDQLPQQAGYGCQTGTCERDRAGPESASHSSRDPARSGSAIDSSRAHCANRDDEGVQPRLFARCRPTRALLTVGFGCVRSQKGHVLFASL